MAIYFAFGSNLGNRAANIGLALRMLAPLVAVEAVSPIYESEPWGGAAGPNYYNAVARVATGLGPAALLRHVKAIEHDIGRREAERWSPRVIDIDIAIYDDSVLDDGDLILPHPRLMDRAFVLRPLLDLDPGITHPVTGDRLAEALARIGEGGLQAVSIHVKGDDATRRPKVRQAIRNIQETVALYAGGRSLAEELIEERRAEAERE